MKNKIKPYILLLPVLIVIISIVFVGITSCLLQSLGYFPVVGLEKITFKYYKEVIKSPEFITSLNFSLYISIVSSVIATILGVILAYCIYKKENKNRIVNLLYKIPIIIPHTIAVILIINTLSRNGIVPRILYSMGLIKSQNSFPNLIMDKDGVGIILTYMWKEIPFIILVVYSVICNIDKKIWETALNLGASKFQTFFYVILPMLMPSILSSFIIIFSFSFGAFEVPYLLGSTKPKALPVKAYIEYSNPDLVNRPYAMVINMILIIICSFLILLYSKCYYYFKKHS
ncbi:ABC transporter permease [Clostridium niameyense]|uniref:ABC transporter permease n=1 Tax=Clostridium niameyense TaxID=1622073 RepID=UPI00067EACF9|nr:ABC transporter permease subunit [Clostridium niameyense]